MLRHLKGLSQHFTEETLRAYLLARSQRRPDGCLVVRGHGRQRGAHQKLAGRAWAHIAAYIVFVGGYDPTLEIHHTCHVKDCIEPRHLTQVTHADTCRARAQAPTCRNGHEREPDTGTGRYRAVCRVCNREAQRRWRARQAEEVSRARRGAPAAPATVMRPDQA